MEGHWLASTMYGASHSVFYYPKHKMLTLDTTESCPFSIALPLEKIKTKIWSLRAHKLLQDTNWE